MRNVIAFSLFCLIIIGTISVNIFNIYGLVSLLILLIVALIACAARYQIVRDRLGFICANIAHYNNHRWYICVSITILLFIAGINYGGGEPLFISAWQNTIGVVRPYYTEERQKTKNLYLYGKMETDLKMKNDRSVLKRFEKNYPILDEESFRKKGGGGSLTEHKSKYNQRISNWSRYGLFADNETIKNLLKQKISAQDRQRNELRKEKKEEKTAVKSWIFWKLFFTFLFLTIIYTPFAFADEVADFLEALKTKIEKSREEVKAGIMPSPGPTPVVTTAAGAAITGKANWFAKLYASEMAAEFTMKFLQTFVKFFRRP